MSRCVPVHVAGGYLLPHVVTFKIHCPFVEAPPSSSLVRAIMKDGTG